MKKKRPAAGLILSFELLLLVFVFLAGGHLYSPVQGTIHYHNSVLREKNFKRLCSSRSMLVVNDSFPGPAIRVQKGDTLFVNVHNQGDYGITIHWHSSAASTKLIVHGVKQLRKNSWSDGPEYITQCPIPPGTNFTYEVKFSKEEGTLWWHAHSDWSRWSIHGAIVVYPVNGTTYPFPTPDDEQILVLGSWYKINVNEVVDEDLKMGADPPRSVAYVINGQPGDFCNCSEVLCCSNLSGFYRPNFPDWLPTILNFTEEDPPSNVTLTTQATKMKMLDYNEEVEITFQGTETSNASENHPMHLHGYSFYVVGSGIGNFNNVTDPLSYNLVDPVELTTVGVPMRGWVTIRFKASNPGVWPWHCHLDRHLSRGMDTVMIVKNGGTPETSLRSPPPCTPRCKVPFANWLQNFDDDSDEELAQLFRE